MKKARPALCVIADRDGTLIEHHDYLSEPGKVCLLPGVAEAVEQLLESGFALAMHTNQSGVGRGYFPLSRVVACQERLFDLLGIKPSDLAGWCMAPEAPEISGGYRKPSPRFIRELCAHLLIDPSRCHMVGDTRVDLETAWNAGAKAWHLACGKPEAPGPTEHPFQRAADFASCVRRILADATGASRFEP